MLLSYFFWHYGRALRGVFVLVGNFFVFGLHLFSLRQLARSLFAPWRNIAMRRTGPLLSRAWWDAIGLNFFSRLLGAIARLCLISVGLLFLLTLGVFGFFVFMSWLVSPLLPPLFIALGVKLLL